MISSREDCQNLREMCMENDTFIAAKMETLMGRNGLVYIGGGVPFLNFVPG